MRPRPLRPARLSRLGAMRVLGAALLLIGLGLARLTAGGAPGGGAAAGAATAGTGTGAGAGAGAGAAADATSPVSPATPPPPAELAQRVVSQSVGTDELLLALAEPAQVAALSHLAAEPEFSAVAREAAAYPCLPKTGDAETILAHRPTLVLFSIYSRAELIAQVRRAGLPVIVIEKFESLDDAYANLRLVARALGPAAEARAERIVADRTTRVEALRERLRGVEPVRVIAPSTYGLIAGADTTFQDLCDHAGAVNLAATLGGLRGHQPPPAERMLTWPVDRVVLAAATREEALAPYRKLPPYQFMEAVRAGRVALIEPYQLSSVTHHRVDAYERLARELHPERFR